MHVLIVVVCFLSSLQATSVTTRQVMTACMLPTCTVG
jgi:hypothetical protein